MTFHAAGRAFIALVYAVIGVFLGFLVGLVVAIAAGAIWPMTPVAVAIGHWLPGLAAAGGGISFVMMYLRETRGRERL
jgi:uncharacterized membrane protein